MAVTNVSDAEFETTVLGNDGVVLVDFWATWCGPCKQIAPSLEEISEEMASDVTVTKVEIEENPTTPMKYGVRGVPTLMLFKDGEPIARKVGADAKANIQKWIRDSLASA